MLSNGQMEESGNASPYSKSLFRDNSSQIPKEINDCMMGWIYELDVFKGLPLQMTGRLQST